ncbi:MAG: glycosyltransferase [Acidimicrobiales bacterium]
MGVVVPAHDEQALIVDCLEALRRAALHPALSGTQVITVVVADACSDGTAERAALAVGTEVLEVSHGNVGRARASGLSHVLGLAAGLHPEALWLASTDADTLVDPDWLARQLAWRRRGAEAVAGMVRVDDWHEQPRGVRPAFEARQRLLRSRRGHGHVHGANLGLSAAAYLGGGGFPGLPLAEDHALWDAITAAGHVVVAATDVAVTTSARREGRAPGGFSQLLRSLDRAGEHDR